MLDIAEAPLHLVQGSRAYMSHHAINDLVAYLEGDWRIRRRVVDRRAMAVGRLIGAARFTPCASGLLYEENGELRLGAHRGPAFQRLLYRLTAPAVAEVRFADGRPFHALDLSQGVATLRHDCAPDRYEGCWIARDGDRFTVRWAVAGPRKDQRIVSRYLRSC